MKPKLKLTGTDGNVFAIISKVSSALERAGQVDKARQFRAEALSSDSYDDVLALVIKYVEVS